MPATINGIVFNDLNNNGQYNAGEPGISGAYVVLFLQPSGPCTVVQTDVNGNYSFSVNTAGTYNVYETVSDPGATCPPTNFTQPAGFTASNGPRTITLTVTAAQISGNAVLANNNFSHTTNNNPLPCSNNFIQFRSIPTQWVNINLVTGNDTIQGGLTPSSTINAIGYNPLDNYLYGVDTTNNNIVRIDQSGNVTTLAPDPTGAVFPYNVASFDQNGFLYLYLGSSTSPSTRFYVLDLRPNSATYMKLVDPTNGYVEETSNYGTVLSTALPQARDWGYSPITNLLYTVDFNGNVQSIDPTTGIVTNLTTTGGVGDIQGYGAIGIDKNGVMYALSNNTGKIYRYTITGNTAKAEEFSQSTASGTNDGALCILAGVDVDFGDAPDTTVGTGVDNYNTLLANDGPRHGIINNLYIGTTITAEADAYQNPTATGDDISKGIQDDGVTAPLTLFTNSTTYSMPVTITNSIGSAANLYGWIDFNKDGVFQGNEAAAVKIVPSAGVQQVVLNFTVPAGVSLVAGHSFARVRLTTDSLSNANGATLQDTRSIGAATDGEVEDYYILITVPYSDVAIVKNAPATVVAGNVLTYTIVATNNGIADASTVVIADNLATALTNPEFSTDNGGSFSSWTSPYGLGTLPTGTSTTIIIKGTVAPSFTGTIVNVATIATSTVDPTIANNSATVATGVVTSADLAVVKTASPNPAVAGQMITYTIVATNAGPSDATNVTISDSLANSVQNPEYSTNNGGSFTSPWLGSYNVGTVPAGTTATIVVRGILSPSASGNNVNVATVSSATPDPNPANNGSEPVTTPITGSADLTTTKVASPNPAVAGQMITYTIVAANAGPSDAGNVTITDSLEGSVQNPEYSTNNGGSFTSPWLGSYNVGTVPAGSTATIVVRGILSPSATGNNVNVATVSSSTSDPNPGNNGSAPVTTPITTSADLTTTKVASPNPAVAGEMITYTIVASNAGPSDATNVTITDSLASSVQNPEYSTNNGGSFTSPWLGSYNVGTVPAGSTATIVVRGILSPSASGNNVNVATVSSSTPDPNPGNNGSAPITTPVTSSADLTTTKVASPNPAVAGQMITYTIVAANAGPSDAGNVTITDSLASSVQNPEYSTDNGGSFTSPWLGSYNVGTVPAGSTATIVVRGILSPSASGNNVNVATVSSSTPDPNPGNNGSAPVTTPVGGSADLTTTKVASPNPAVAGEMITYTIVAANVGPSDATNVTITDSLASSVQNPEYSTNNGGSFTSPWLGSYNVGTVPAGSTATIVVRGILSPSATGNNVNVATVSSSTPDPNPGNNGSAPITTPITTSADLTTTKVASPNPAVAGEMITYTIVASNAGPSDATNVTITDSLASSVQNPEYSTNNGGSFTSPWLGSYNVGTVPAGSTATIVVRGILSPSASGNNVNVATVSSSTPDPNPGNNGSAPITTPITASADLTTTKVASPNPAVAGQMITYTIVASNAGPSDAGNVTISDSLASSVQNPEYSTNNGGSFTSPWLGSYNVGTVPAGSTATIVVRGILSPSASGNNVNVATVSSSTPDPNPGNNGSAPITTPVGGSADLTTTKVASPNPAVAGEMITYTIVAANAGPSDAGNVTITDSLASSVQNPEYSTNNGGSFTSPWLGSYNVGTVPAGSTATIVVRGILSPSATGNNVNVATVSSSTPDPNPGNNGSAPITTPITTSADLTTTKVASPNPAVAGQMITYTIVASNAGPSDARNVTITDSLASSVQNPEYSTNNGGSFTSPWLGSYNVGTVPAGSTATIVVRGILSPSASGNNVNVATVSSSTPDPNPGNNGSAPITTPVTSSADLTTTKVASPNPAVAGQMITYTIVASNAGPSDAGNVTITDSLASSVQNPEYSTNNGGSFTSPWLGSYNVGTVPAGSTATIVVRGILSPSASGNNVNVATVSSTTPDPNPGNNGSAPITTPVTGSADLTTTKVASPNPAVAGQMITYTIVASNAGPSDAGNVTITDSLEGSVQNPEYSTNNGGSFTSPWLGSYNVGTVPAGSTATIVVRGILSPSASGNNVNVATVSSSTPDPNPGNNGSAPITTPVTGSADLTTTKVASPNPAVAGQMITYTIVAKNAGPSDAGNVTITDSLDGSIQNPEYSTNNGGSFTSPWLGSYNVGTVPAGSTATIVVRGILSPSASGNNVNVATVSSSTPDPNPGNNGSAPITTPVTASADLTTTKVGSPNPAVAGQMLTYTIVAKNAGPSDAGNVTITDSLASSIQNPEYSTNNGGSFTSPWPGSYNVGTVPAGSTATIVVRGILSSAATGNAVNVATVSSSTPDPNPGNNGSAPSTLPVSKSADLSVNKTVVKSNLNRGDTVNYSIVASNAGPSDATGVTITDSISTNITNPQFSIDGGTTYNPWVSPYNLGTVVAGTSKTILIKGIIGQNALGTIPNTATVTSAVSDPNPSGNNSTVNINVNYADLLGPSGGNFVKTADKQYATIGDEITYTVTLKNSGNVPANNVVITDPLPNGTSYINGSLIGDVPLTGSPLTTINITNGIAPGQTINISYKVKVTSLPTTNPIKNVASVTYNYTTDPGAPNGGSGSGSSNGAETQINSGDIAPGDAVKTVDKNPTTAGDIVTYTITVKNTGNVPVNNVVVKDALPTGTSFVDGSVTVNGIGKPAEKPVPGINVGTVNPGQTAIVTLKAKILDNAPDPIVNKATIEYDFIVDPNKPPVKKSVDTNSLTTDNVVAKASVVKTADRTGAAVGDIIRYSIVVQNTGETPLNNVVVKDSLSQYLEYKNNLTINGVPSAQDITTGVNLGTLAIGESKTVAFDTKVLSAPPSGTSLNTAVTTFDYTVSGNTFTKTTSSNGTAVKVYTPKVDITKSSNKPSVKVGETFSYFVNVKNSGDIAVDNVIVKDSLPAELQVVDVKVDGISVNGDLATGINVGTVNVGETKVVEIIVKVLADLTADYKNKAEVSAQVKSDPNKPPSIITGSGTDAGGVAVYNPSATLTKSANRSYATLGTIVTYTMVVKNTGDIALGDVDLDPVMVYDLLGPGLQFVEGSVKVNGVSRPNDNITSGVNVGRLDIGESKTISFDAKIVDDKVSPIKNNARANFGYTLPGRQGEIGSTVSNEVDIQILIVDLSVEKTADKDFVVIGDEITYTVKIKNNGDVDALNVIFKDNLPAEVELVQGSFSIDGIKINSVNLEQGVNVGNIPKNGEKIIKYTVKVKSTNCNFKLVNSAMVKYDYILPDGTISEKTSLATDSSKVEVKLGINNFKQISIEDNLIIPIQKPDIEEILKITGEIEIAKAHVIRTAVSTSNEGQNLTGYKLVVKAILKAVIEYTALDVEQTVHSAHYDIPFSTFIVIQDNSMNFNSLDLKGEVEHIYFKALNEREVFTNVTALIKVTICN